MRRRALSGSALAVLTAAALLAQPLTSRAATAPSVAYDTALEGMFAAYGNSGVGWTGGDGAYSVVLPDGRRVWAFSDTFLGPVNADGSRPMTAPFIHNSYVIQSHGRLVDTLYTTNAFGKFGLVNTTDGQTYYWMGAQVVEGNYLRQFVNRFAAAGGEFQQVGVDVATFSLPDLKLLSITPSPGGYLPTWQGGEPVDYGQAIMQDGGWDYIYGVEDYPLNKFLHVARVPAGHLLDGTWEYWTGHAWSTDEVLSWRQVQEIADEFSVVATRHGYRLVAQYFGITASIQMYTAADPMFDSPSGPVTLYTTPETTSTVTTYNAKEHPDLDRPDHLVISYNVNSSGNGDYQNVDNYRPRFIDVYIPSDLPRG